MILKPLISVIIPNYNHFAYLSKRIDSVLNQTYQNSEIILLDDKSSDRSLEILKEYESHPKVSFCIINKENSGNTFFQWKKGIEIAKGKLIWIAESDDYCESDFLDKMVKIFAYDKNISLVFCQSHKVNAKGEITGNWRENTSKFERNIFKNDFLMDGNEFIEKYLIFQNVIPNASAVLFRREIALERDLPDTSSDLIYSGDWLFYLQMIINKKISFKSETLNYFRYHDSSVIAGARKKESIATIVDKDSKMRKKMLCYLKKQNPENFSGIEYNNKNIVRDYQLKKANSLFRLKKKRKGLMVLLPVLDLYILNLRFFKRLKSKVNSFSKKTN